MNCQSPINCCLDLGVEEEPAGARADVQNLELQLRVSSVNPPNLLERQQNSRAGKTVLFWGYFGEGSCRSQQAAEGEDGENNRRGKSRLTEKICFRLSFFFK